MAKLTAENVLKVALSWDNYYEKASGGTDAQLKNKTWNAGYNNYTWFWVALNRLGYGNYQAQPWCDGFVDYCFIECAGGDAAAYKRAAKALGGMSAYTPTSANMFKKLGSGHWIEPNGTPLPGDQIFFKNSSGICHTGLVLRVTSSTVYTIEGNTSSASGVIANGGCTRQKSYSRSYANIAGYGRPLWEDGSSTNIPANTGTVVLRQGDKGDAVKTMQQLLIKAGYDLGSYGADGDFGGSTFTAVKKFQSDYKTTYNLSVDGEYGPDSKAALEKVAAGKTTTTVVVLRKGDKGAEVKKMQELLLTRGYNLGTSGADGDFGDATYQALKQFQAYHNLDADGDYGPASRAILEQPFNRGYLQNGDSGEEVRTMQLLLLKAGYSVGAAGADGDFGSGTETAVKAFQTKAGLNATGKYDSTTKTKLEAAAKATEAANDASKPATETTTSNYKYGVKGSKVVKAYQKMLKNTWKYEKVTVTGNFDQALLEAVVDFQTYHGLEANGQLNAATRKKIKNEKYHEIPDNWIAKYQYQLNVSNNKKLDVNGKWNDATEKAYVKLNLGKSGSLVRLVQEILVTKFKRNISITGSYDKDTVTAVSFVQSYYGIKGKGECGTRTWKALICNDYPKK